MRMEVLFLIESSVGILIAMIIYWLCAHVLSFVSGWYTSWWDFIKQSVVWMVCVAVSTVIIWLILLAGHDHMHLLFSLTFDRLPYSCTNLIRIVVAFVWATFTLHVLDFWIMFSSSVAVIDKKTGMERDLVENDMTRGLLEIENMLSP